VYGDERLLGAPGCPCSPCLNLPASSSLGFASAARAELALPSHGASLAPYSHLRPRASSAWAAREEAGGFVGPGSSREDGRGQVSALPRGQGPAVWGGVAGLQADGGNGGSVSHQHPHQPLPVHTRHDSLSSGGASYRTPVSALGPRPSASTYPGNFVSISTSAQAGSESMGTPRAGPVDVYAYDGVRQHVPAAAMPSTAYHAPPTCIHPVALQSSRLFSGSLACLPLGLSRVTICV